MQSKYVLLVKAHFFPQKKSRAKFVFLQNLGKIRQKEKSRNNPKPHLKPKNA